MTYSGRRVLVTGAGGFIGSHLTERLVQAGAHVTAFIHYNALGSCGWLQHSPVRGALRIVAGDIADRDTVREAMKEAETVFHLAALIGIPYSYHASASYVRVNVEGTLNVLQTAKELGVRRLVHTSTSEVYGTARYAPMDEEHPLQGQSPYAATKIGADKLVEAFVLSFGVPAVTMRPFNTFGPRQTMRAVIPTIIGQCCSGDVIRLGNVHPTRDLSFVSDTVDGYLLAGERPDIEGETINLGSGREISIGDLAHLVGHLMSKQIRIEVEDERTRCAGTEVERLLAHTGRALRLLGWTPRVSLEEGLLQTIEWMARNQQDYREARYVI